MNADPQRFALDRDTFGRFFQHVSELNWLDRIALLSSTLLGLLLLLLLSPVFLVVGIWILLGRLHLPAARASAPPTPSVASLRSGLGA